MIEVVPRDDGFRWTMISDAGRLLAHAAETFPCINSAAHAAKAWRLEFWRITHSVDQRVSAI